jgi:hypothetical protein
VVASAEASAEPPAAQAASHRSSQAWAMLIKRVCEVDPLCCPECGGQLKVVSFIEPPQADVIEAILKHCGLWQSRSPRGRPEVHEFMNWCSIWTPPTLAIPSKHFPKPTSLKN